jgi:hypothetical protein
MSLPPDLLVRAIQDDRLRQAAQRHQQWPARLPRRPRPLPTVRWKSLLLRALARSTTPPGKRGSVRWVHHRPASPGER